MYILLSTAPASGWGALPAQTPPELRACIKHAAVRYFAPTVYAGEIRVRVCRGKKGKNTKLQNLRISDLMIVTGLKTLITWTKTK